MFAPRACGRCASRMRLVAGKARAHTASFVSSPAEVVPEAPSTRDKRRPREASQSNRGNRRRVQQASSPRKADSLDDAAMALFNEVVKPPKAKDSTTTEDDTAAVAAAVSPLTESDLLRRIYKLDQKVMNPRVKLDVFEADIWPHVYASMTGESELSKPLWMALTQFVTRITETAVTTLSTGGVALRISQLAARIGKLELDMRGQLAFGLCYSLLESPLPSTGRKDVVRELLDFWRHISQLKRVSQPLDAPLRFVLPEPHEIKDVRNAAEWGHGEMTPMGKALASIFVQFQLSDSRNLVPALMATLAILSDPRYARSGFKVQAAPLLDIVRSILSPDRPDERTVARTFADDKVNLPEYYVPKVRDYVVTQWPKVWDMLLNPVERPSEPGSPGPPPLSTWHKQLRAAYRSRNTGAVAALWKDFRRSLERWPSLKRFLRGDPEHIDFWVFVWCAMRRPASLAETVQLMEEIDLQPTVRTYTAMLHGWRLGRQWDKVLALWERLLVADVKLDVIIWTERISGLIESGHSQSGVQAVADMMALWKQAVEKYGGNAEAAAAAGAVEPNIQVINAAFKGLVRVDPKAAHELLDWAGQHGIEPNVRTFNILISENFRHSQPQRVQQLLQTMRQRGIEPDSATFTIILEETLGAMQHASPAEQVHAVEQVLADIEASGLRANQETFGKMLYAVSSLTHGGSDEAVDIVQRRMRALGLTITPHMVTILLERLIARGGGVGRGGLKPGAVDALLREHGIHDVSQGDQTLWERVVSAHAVTRDTAAAMRVFNALAAAGRPVTSLPSLTDLVHALLADDRRADARRVARAAMNAALERSPPSSTSSTSSSSSFVSSSSSAEPVTATTGTDADARYWKHHFWHLSAAEGLLDWKNVPPELKQRLSRS